LNLLAFDTSTERLSLALSWAGGAGQRQLAREGQGGREASATLIPAAMELLREAGLRLSSLDAIVFGSGPGSFTGLRSSCAVAQGLALGANLPVLPLETLMAVAEEVRAAHGTTRVMAVLDARMDEVYAARCEHDGRQWHAPSDFWLGAPEQLALPPGAWLVGNALAAYPGRLPATDRHCAARPTAQALLRLAPQCRARGLAVEPALALPRYVRDKVALTTAERAARTASAQARAESAPKSGP